MPTRATFFKLYIVFLMGSLAMEIKLFSIPKLSIESIPPGIIFMAIGFVLPLFFFRDFLAFVKENLFLPLLCSAFLICGMISVMNSPFPKIYTGKWLIQFGLNMGISLILLFLFNMNRELGHFFLKTAMVLAVLCSLVSMVETGSESLFHFLADTFRNGAYQVINGHLRPAATLGHSNILGCFLSLGILLCILLKDCFRRKGAVFYPSVLCLSIGVALTGSRNAMLVLGIPLGLLLFNGKTMKPTLSVLIISAVCVVVLTPSTSRITDVWRLVENVEKKHEAHTYTGKNGPGKFNTAETRFMFWDAAIRMFNDHPVFGIGPGGYNWAIADYASESLLAIEASGIEQKRLNAHNGFFNLLAEFGITGVMAGGLFLILLLLNLARRYPMWPPSAVHAVVLGLLISFGPDAFFHNKFYMVFFFSLLLLLCFGKERLPGISKTNTRTTFNKE